MAEVADAGKDHGHAKPVGCSDDLGVADRAAGLDDGGCTGIGDGFEAVGEREEGVGGGYGSFEREDGFHGSEAGRVDPAHLAGSDADGLAMSFGEAGVDDGV